MVLYSRNHVKKAVNKLFPQHKMDLILKILDDYGKEEYEYESSRVHLAILKCSEGELAKLREYVKHAKMDYRDVLLWAEYRKVGKDFAEIKNPYHKLIE